MIRPPKPDLPEHTLDVQQRFLLLCLRSRWHRCDLDEARQLCAVHAIDWLSLGKRAVHEGVAPLLYISLRGRELVPLWLERELKQVYELNARRNLRLLYELAQALRALEHEGITTAVLKGAALTESLYDNIALRPMFDLDILIRPEALSSAVSILTELGYSRQMPEVYEGATLDNENEVLLTKRGPLDVVLELHWGLIDSPFYQKKMVIDWFWETAVSVQVWGANTRMLGLEALLLHLCAHLALHHRGKGLLWQHDLALMLHAFEDRLNWETVLAKIQMMAMVLPAQHVLKQVACDWHAPIPDAVLHQLSALQPSPAEMRVYSWLSKPVRPVVQRFWSDLISMPDWRSRLRYGVHNLFPSAAYMRQRYNITRPLLLPFYYPYRWWLGLASVCRADDRRRSSRSQFGSSAE